MKTHFGNLKVMRGNEHRFLGMNITINKKNSIEIEMKDQLQETIDMFFKSQGSNVTEEVTSPARSRLRDVNPQGVPLSKHKEDAFHSIIAKLLWIM